MAAPQGGVNSVALRAARVPGWIRAILLLIPLGLTLYWGFTGTGLYAWVASVQMQLMGSYLLLLTGMVTFIVAMLPSVVLIQLLAPLFGPRDVGAVVRDRAITDAQVRRWTFPVVMALFGVGMAAFGGVRYLESFGYGDVVPIELDARRWPPEAQYVEVRAPLDLDSAVTWEEEVNSGTSIATHYVPVAAAKSEPVLLVARMNDGGLVKARAGQPLRGVLRGAPSAIVATSLLEVGVRLGPQTIVLDTRDSPDSVREFGMIFGTVGLGMLAIAAVAAAVIVRRRR